MIRFGCHITESAGSTLKLRKTLVPLQKFSCASYPTVPISDLRSSTRRWAHFKLNSKSSTTRGCGEVTPNKANRMETQVGNFSLDEKVDVGANGVKEMQSGPKSRLRILCMHGFRTSGSILSQQVARAKWSPLVDDIAELVFIDAPWPAQGKSDVEEKFPGPYFEWYQSNKDYTVASGLDESTSHLTDYISLHGPFDGVLGFSQGAVLAGALMGLCNKGVGPNLGNIRFLISVGGGRARAIRLLPAYSEPIKCPSLHFLGEKDFMKPYGEELVAKYKDPLIIRHPFGHVVPRLGASEGQIFRDFLLKQLRFKLASGHDQNDHEDAKISELVNLEAV